MDLLRDIHSGLEPPVKYSKISFIRGSYSYYHYLCDKTDDKGWGCGYRTLQTICSWIIEQQKQKRFMKVPSIKEIQRALVEIGDKEDDFIESKEWIGTVEVAYVIDHIYEIPCRIMHNRSLKDLKDQANNILQHFEEYGSPIMMGPSFLW
nr:probable Ufm1-specific protease 1 isoform X2 [Parasteatoda tepidariorum]